MNCLKLLLFGTLLCAIISGCSSSEEPEKPSKLKEAQEKIAAEAVESIKTPIDQAKLAKQLTEQHNVSVEEKVQQQQ